jgi:heme oxygenase
MYQPIMTSLQNVQQGLHSDIDALSAQLGSLSTQEQYQQIQNRQDLIEQRVAVLKITSIPSVTTSA